MAQHTCPNCSHTFTPETRQRSTPAAVADTATMTTAELFAHYKRTAPLEDLRFILRAPDLSPGLRARIESALRGRPAPAVVRSLITARRVEAQATTRTPASAEANARAWQRWLDEHPPVRSPYSGRDPGVRMSRIAAEQQLAQHRDARRRSVA